MRSTAQPSWRSRRDANTRRDNVAFNFASPMSPRAFFRVELAAELSMAARLLRLRARCAGEFPEQCGPVGFGRYVAIVQSTSSQQMCADSDCLEQHEGSGRGH